MRAILSLILLVLAGPLAAAGQPPPSFVVVINAANPTPSASRGQVADMFMRRTKMWKGGLQCRPVDLAEASRIREAFSRRILGRRTAEVREYWQAAIFSGRGVPPPKKVSEEDVMKFVQKYPGAIGYVSANTPLPPQVKILQIED